MTLHNESESDRLIDGMLASYSNVMPREGLEQRVLANLRAQHERRRRTWFAVPFTASAAALILVFFLNRPLPSPSLSLQRAAAPVESGWGTQSVLRSEPTKTQIKRQRKAVSSRVLRQPVQIQKEPRPLTAFSSGPLSEQERLMVAFAQENPKEAAATVTWQVLQR